MDQVLAFVVAVALAAAALAAVGYFALPVASAVDWSDAFAYPTAMRVGDVFQLGVVPAYADVVVKRVWINGAPYDLNVKAPYGNVTWLPVYARCNDTVVLEIARGSAARALQFKAVCPTGEVRGIYMLDLGEIRRGFLAFAEALAQLAADNPMLAVTVRDSAIRVVNTGDVPLLLFAGVGSTETSPGGPGALPGLYTVPPDVQLLGILLPNQSLPIVGLKQYYFIYWELDWRIAFTVLRSGNYTFINGMLFKGAPKYYVPSSCSSNPASCLGGAKLPNGVLYMLDQSVNSLYPSVLVNDTGTYAFNPLNARWEKVGTTFVLRINASIEFPSVNNNTRFYAPGSAGSGYMWLWAFPALPVYANASGNGQFLIGETGAVMKGGSQLAGLGALSPVRTYAVEARHNITHWLVTVGVPGYDLADPNSTIKLVLPDGVYNVTAAVTTTSVTITVTDASGKVLASRTVQYNSSQTVPCATGGCAVLTSTVMLNLTEVPAGNYTAKLAYARKTAGGYWPSSVPPPQRKPLPTWNAVYGPADHISVPLLYEVRTIPSIKPYKLVYSLDKKLLWCSSNPVCIDWQCIYQGKLAEYVFSIFAQLYYDGKPVSYWGQTMRIKGGPATECPSGGGASGGGTIPEIEPVCWTTKYKEPVEIYDKNLTKLGNGKYYDEIWIKWKIIEIDCKGNTKTYTVDELWQTVYNPGTGTYSYYDQKNDMMCSLGGATTGQDGKVICGQ